MRPVWETRPRVRIDKRIGTPTPVIQIRFARDKDARCIENARLDHSVRIGDGATILLVEAAGAFEELTLSDRDDELVWQEARAWPNSFRTTRFTPAVEFLQAQRFRRLVCGMMAEQFEGLDAMISPSYAASLLLITNNTGHPSLTIRSGFREVHTATPIRRSWWTSEGILRRIELSLIALKYGQVPVERECCSE